MNQQSLSESDLSHLQSVAWGIVKRTGQAGWIDAENPSTNIDGRTLARLERLGLIVGVQIGTTARSACVRARITPKGTDLVEKLRHQRRI